MVLALRMLSCMRRPARAGRRRFLNGLRVPPGADKGLRDSPFFLEFMADILTVAQQALLGFDVELVDVERAPLGLLRVVIDRPEGVRIEDCEQVSRQLSHVFEVENIDYKRLEVSSPGVDRPLRRLADYVRFAGERIELRLHEPVESRKTFTGILRASGDEPPVLSLDWEDQSGQTRTLPFSFDDVDRARLDPVLDFKGKKR
ncbi:Ribosome maturation factor RimP [Castellaniella denitrificans]